MLDHIQYILIHGPNLPGSYAVLLFIALVLFSLPDTSTTKHHFSFGPADSFFLELIVIAFCTCPVAYWTPFNLGGSSSGVIYFCLFILFMGFSQQEYWSGFLFPHPEHHVLSELFTMTNPSALHGMAHTFIELCKPLRHDKAVIHEGAVPKHNVNHKNKYNHTSKHVLITDLLQEKLGEEFPLI